MMKTMNERIVEVSGIIKRCDRVAYRVRVLEMLGYKVRIRRLGSGGVGAIKHSRIETRVQVGYGSGGSRYGPCVIFD